MTDPVSASPRDDTIRRHFEQQAVGSEQTGSPFVAVLCRLLAARLDRSTGFGQAIFDWPGDPRDDALPLRVVGALHALVRSGREPALAAAYPPAGFDARVLWTALSDAIPRNAATLTAFLDSPSQTNEVARSALILGGALHVANRTGLPIEIYEIGASAGLNLAFDEYRYDLGDGQSWGRPDAPVTIQCEWRGALPPLGVRLEIVGRAGCDRRPIDPAAAADAERLMAYIWADQPHRLERTAAALAHAAARGRTVTRADAGEWAAQMLGRPGRGRVCRMLVHTIVWQYMPSEPQKRVAAAIDSAAAAATEETPFAHFAFEPDGADGTGRMTLTIWPGGRTETLGRAHFHGRFAHWA